MTFSNPPARSGRFAVWGPGVVAQAYAGVLSVTTQPAINRVYQRDTLTGGASAKGAGAIGLVANLTTAATSLEYRSIDATTLAAIDGWTNLGAVASGASTLPLVISARAGWCKLQLRANGDDTSIITSANPIGVGEVIGFAGQSEVTTFVNATFFASDSTTIAAQGVTISPFGVVYASWGLGTTYINDPPSAPAWAAPADGSAYSSAAAAEFLRLMVGTAGVNVALVSHSIGSTAISYWQSGQLGAAKLRNRLTEAGSKGRLMLWYQGAQDATLGTTEAAYRTALAAVFAGLVTDYPGQFGKRVVCTLGSIGSYTTLTAMEVIRHAGLSYCDVDDANAQLVACLDVALTGDNAHSTQGGNLTMGRHFYRAAAKALGLLAYGDADGPRLGTPTRATGSKVISFPVTYTSGTAMVPVGSPLANFTVFAAGTATTALPLSAIDTSNPAQIALTLTSLPPDVAALGVRYHYTPDVSLTSSGIYANATDGDGLTQGRMIRLTAAELTAAAPYVGTNAATLSGSASTNGTAGAFPWTLTTTTTGNVGLYKAGVLQGTLVGISGASGTASLTPSSVGVFTARIFDGAGVFLAETGTFTVSAAQLGANVPAISSGTLLADFNAADFGLGGLGQLDNTTIPTTYTDRVGVPWSTSSGAPKLRVAVVAANLRDTVRFTMASTTVFDALTGTNAAVLAALGASASSTVVVVHKQTAVPAAAVTILAATASTAPDGGQQHTTLQINGSGATPLRFAANQNNSNVAVATSAGNPTTVFNILVGIKDGASLANKTRVGMNGETPVISGGSVTGMASMARLDVSASWNPAGNGGAGSYTAINSQDIARILIYSGVVSAADLSSIRAALQTYYATP